MHALPAPAGPIRCAEPRHIEGVGWYVFWETAGAFGSAGTGLSEERAHALASALLSGEVPSALDPA